MKGTFCNSCNIFFRRLLLELEVCWYLYTSWSSRQQFWPMDKSKQRSDASLINKNYQKSQRILSIGWTWKNYTGKIYKICNFHLQQSCTCIEFVSHDKCFAWLWFLIGFFLIPPSVLPIPNFVMCQFECFSAIVCIVKQILNKCIRKRILSTLSTKLDFAQGRRVEISMGPFYLPFICTKL